MTKDRIAPNDGLAARVVDSWAALGIGVPDTLAHRHDLILPIFRHGTWQGPLVIELSAWDGGTSWSAQVHDGAVHAAANASHAYECVLKEYDGVISLNREDDINDSCLIALQTTSFSILARRAWLLHQCCQRLLDFAEGVRIGKPLVPKFDADRLVRAVTGLELGARRVEVR